MISENIPQLCKSTIDASLIMLFVQRTSGTAAGEEWLFKAQLLVVVTSLVSVSSVF